jgi:protein-ribulosamine 3-kinase
LDFIMIPEAAQTWLKENNYGMIISKRAVGGGCINNGMILQAEAGKSFFLKTNRTSPSDMFAREAEGLQALRTDDGPIVPEPLLYGQDFILMADLSPSGRGEDYWPDFGRRMAALHSRTIPQFGFAHDNYIGSTPQPNPWMEDGYEFFAEQRLRYMTRLARQRSLMTAGDAQKVDILISHLPERIPQQPASLIHGDLWSGNISCDATGAPAIIDPAVHYGWAEAELAMMTLFGSFPAEFIQAYQEIRPLEPGFRARFSIYNLYHLLNHLNIFGRSYLGQVQSILRKYA